MLLIRLTQKLQKEIGVKPADLAVAQTSRAPFEEWYAHVFTLGRKKQLIFVETITLFSFCLENVSRKDMRERLPELFRKGLSKALYIEGASAEVMSKVLDMCRGELIFAKTESRKTIAAMNEFVKHIKFGFSYHGRSIDIQDRSNRYMPVRGFPDGSKEYKFPIEVFAKVIKEQYGLAFTPQKEEYFKEKIIREQANVCWPVILKYEQRKAVEMGKNIREIPCLVTKGELELMKEACMYGAGADDNINKAIFRNGKYHLLFSCEELDDFIGYIASCANHEESLRKQPKWDKLYDKLDGYLKYYELMPLTKGPLANNNAKCALRYFIFEVSLDFDEWRDTVFRKIQIAEAKTLNVLAKTIIKAYGFYFDHCFGFYDNFERYHDSEKAFELFVDIGEEPLNATTKGVERTKIKEAFKKPGDKMLFLFDYGDGWRFIVELKEIRNADKWDLKPVVLESIGEAPVQYPPCDE